MTIAILTPHPVPLALGGAENLVWGLQAAFHAAGHRCEVIGQVSPERNLAEVLTSYAAFAAVDVSRYETVISGKYPAWMVRHPRHRLYMLHRLRGLYDTYGGPQSSDARPDIAGFLSWLTQTGTGASAGEEGVVERIVERALGLVERYDGDPAFSYPGPIARAIVHALDGLAITRRRITSFAAISRTVARREGYFPAGIDADVLYPPPHRNDYRCGDSAYFFTSSRLDGPKRVALMIEAMRHVSKDIPLLIAGTGPQDDALRTLAGNDPRIRFLGFVSDDEMVDLYADALAVPFVPFDEDYGLVTLEAMRSGKPVVTVDDSGGPCEFVEHGVTGLVTPPRADALGAALSQLAADPDEAAAMGRRARDRVDPIRWDTIVERLTAPPPARFGRRGARRRKLVVATTFPVYPPRGGGQARVFHLYRHLAKTFDIDIVSFGQVEEPPSKREIAPGLVEIRIGKTREHDRHERALMLALNGVPVGDVTMPLLARFTPGYRTALARAAGHADAVVACHPYLYDVIREAAAGRALWYEGQDVEIVLKADVFAAADQKDVVLHAVRQAEGACWNEAELVFGCTDGDLGELARLYGRRDRATLTVPNGVCLEETPHTTYESRRRLKTSLGADGRRIALFIGSWHPPNIDAVETIVAVAAQCPEIDFIVAGTAGAGYRARHAGSPLPPNVRLLGLVSHAIRNLLLAGADLALNPMTYGSGSNLKMFDYFASGIPVVTTPFGARGMDLADGLEAIVAPAATFAEGVRRLVAMEPDDLDAMQARARGLVERSFSWERIAMNFASEIKTLGLI